MGVVGRLDQYASMLAWEFDETTANNPSITGLGTYYASEFNENIVDIVRDGLVLNLDAGNLSSYSGSGTTWTDLSGSGNTGTLVNSPTYSSVNGGSIVFNGTNQSASTLLSTNTLNNITQSVWFKWNGTNQVNAIIYLGNPNSNGFGLYIGSSGTPSNLLGVLFGGSLFNALSSSVTLTTNWTNFVITRDSTTTSLYQNGSLFASTTNTPLTSASYPFIGNYGAGGNISNISFYNRALTATEVAQNYNALATRYGLATTNSTAPMLANVFAPYDPVYDEFSGTSFGAGQGRYMRQNTDKSVIVYNEIDEVTDLFGRGIVRDGLVLDLDAGKTASYSGSGTAWTDLSASGNNGTLINMDGTNFSSSNGGYLTFDATNEYITSTFSTTSGQAVTYCGWLYSTETVTYRNFVDSVTARPMIWWNNSGQIEFDAALYTTPAVYRNQWVYVALSKPSGSSSASYYVNGVLVGSGSAYTTPAVTPTWFNRAGAQTWRGNCSTVQVYNRALSAAEIQQNYNALRNRFGL